MKEIDPILITTEGLFFGVILFFMLLINFLGNLENDNPNNLLEKVKEKEEALNEKEEKLKKIEQQLKQV